MKAIIKNKKPEFEPIELVVTMESLTDVKGLWNALFESREHYAERSKDRETYPMEAKDFKSLFAVWCVLDDIIRAHDQN